MTREEKAKAYDEAVNKIKPLYEQAKRDGNPIWSTYEYLIPELAESEDERIRKELVEYLKGDLDDITTDDTDRWINWLEKQKEQKPAEWSEEDKAIVGCIACCLDGSFVTEAARKQCLEWFNKHRRDFLNSPSWKPSEEQMKALADTLEDMPEHYKPKYTLELLERDLKKL